jgi:hypothetical protein
LLPAALPEDVLAKLKYVQDNLQGIAAPKLPKVKKQGTDKIVSDIVSDLNKLTPDTYKQLYPALLKNTRLCQPEQLQRVAGLILEIASSNRFYTDVYAHLYINLSENFAELKKVYTDKCQTHMDFVCVAVDPSTDYDAYCAERALAEKRLAFTAFCTHLGEHKQLLARFEARFEENLGNAGLLEELLEHMLVVHARCKSSPAFAKRVLETTNLSNKLMFKCEDIADLYK